MNNISLMTSMIIDYSQRGDQEITLLHNYSRWGHVWKAGQIPSYDTISSFKKHIISLSACSLKGFKRLSEKHVRHLIPENRMDWVGGLLRSISDLCNNGDPEYFGKILENGVSTVTRNQPRCSRVYGKKLVNLLLEVNAHEAFLNSHLCGANEGISESFQKFAEVKRNEWILRRQQGFNFYYEGYQIQFDGRKEMMAFTDVDVLEGMIIEASFGRSRRDSTEHLSGDGIIPKILSVFARNGDVESKRRLSEMVFHLSCDILRVALALDSVESIQNVVGNGWDIDESMKEGLRFKFEAFLECVIPVLCYNTICNAVNKKILLDRASLFKLIRKARLSRRVLFKNLRERLCTKRMNRSGNGNVTISGETTPEELQEMMEVASNSAASGVIEFVINAEEVDDANTTCSSAIDEILSEEELSESISSFNANDPFIKDSSGLGVNNEVGMTVNAAEGIRNFETGIEIVDDGLLSFAGASIFMEEKLGDVNGGLKVSEKNEKKKKVGQRNEKALSSVENSRDVGSPSNGSLSEEVSKTPLVERMSSSSESKSGGSGPFSSTRIEFEGTKGKQRDRRLASPILPVANVCDRTLGNDDISTPEGRQVSRSWGSNSGSGTSGDGPFSSTKFGEGVRVAGADLRRGLSPILRTSPIRGKTGCCGMRSRQVAPMEVLAEAKILQYLEREATKLTEKEKAKLLQYIAKDPPDVKKDKWNQVLEVVGEALLNGNFMIKTAVAARTGAAVLIARYVSRLATEHEEGLSEIKKAEFEALMKDESKFYRLDMTLSKLKFMQQKLRTGDSVYYLAAILRVFYSDAIRKSSALKIQNLCKK